MTDAQPKALTFIDYLVNFMIENRRATGGEVRTFRSWQELRDEPERREPME